MRLVLNIAKHGSVSEAAFEEGLSQSTASYRLDRLRQIFDDVLFLRGPAGMEPTAKGARTIATFTAMLEQFDGLTDPLEFDPATASRSFEIAATALEIETVLAPFQRQLATLAPNCRLIVRPMETRSLTEALRDHWDIALLSEPPKSSTLKQVLLLRDELVTYFDPNVRSAPATLEDFCAADHAVASLGGTPRSGVDLQLRKLNLKRRIELETSNIESLAPMMKGTALITTIPSRLAPGLMRDFQGVACPLSFPSIPFHAVWHLSKDADPVHQWLRQTLRNVARQNAL